jgi:hypothetical protein
VTTTFGAHIICAKCGARPWPDRPDVRETFDLLRVDTRPEGKNRTSASPVFREWICERCPPRKRDVRVSSEKGAAA